VCHNPWYEALHAFGLSPLNVLRALVVGLNTGALGWEITGGESRRVLLGPLHGRYLGERKVGSVGWPIDG
jgi:hypothetical protein